MEKEDQALSRGGRYKQHLLDSRLISDTKNAILTTGKLAKSERNPLFTEEKPWEVRLDNIDPNIIYDKEDKIFKCWYSSFIVDERTTTTPRYLRNSTNNYWSVRPNGRETGLCYATSEDGYTWEKPELGLVEFNGSKKNNILMRDFPIVNGKKYAYNNDSGNAFKSLIADNGMYCGLIGTGVFKDDHAVSENQRYKSIFKLHESICVSFSKDGIHWEEPIPCPEIDATGDNHSNALWVPEMNKYVGIVRVWDKKRFIRKIGWTCSDDFLHWTKPKPVLEGDSPNRQIYCMPVFRYNNVYIGLPAVFNNLTDTVHTELAWSPDTIEWHRINPGRPFIPRSSFDADYDWGCVFAGVAPVLFNNRFFVYYAGGNGPHTGWRDGFLCLADIHPDAIAGYTQKSDKHRSSVTTKPLPCKGRDMHIWTDVDDDGYLQIEILGLDGKVLVKSEPVRVCSSYGDTVKWIGTRDLSGFLGEEICVKFTFSNTTIFTFSFE